jgi:antitoxin FitA
MASSRSGARGKQARRATGRTPTRDACRNFEYDATGFDTGEIAMSILTIPDLDDDLKRRLDERATRHGHTPEAEARTILSDALRRGEVAPDNLADAIRAIVEPYGGFEFELPPDQPVAEPMRFD